MAQNAFSPHILRLERHGPIGDWAENNRGKAGVTDARCSITRAAYDRMVDAFLETSRATLETIAASLVISLVSAE